MNKPYETLAIAAVNPSGLRQRLVETALLTDGTALAVWALHAGDGAGARALQAQHLSAAGVALSAPLTLAAGAAALQVRASALADGGAVVAWAADTGAVQAAVLDPAFKTAVLAPVQLSLEPGQEWVLQAADAGSFEIRVRTAEGSLSEPHVFAQQAAVQNQGDEALAAFSTQPDLGAQAEADGALPAAAPDALQAAAGATRAALLDPQAPLSVGPAVTPLAWGEERVNTYLASNQTEPEVAVLADGSYVVVWQSTGQDGSGEGVYAQRFASNGRAFGPEWRVNSNTPGTQEYPHVAALSDGGFVVVWQDNSGLDGSGWATVAQRYTAQSAPAGSNFIVNTTTVNSQYHGVVASYAGGFAIAWAADGSSDVHLKRYDNAGAVTLAETLISSAGNTATGQTGTQYLPSIAARADGSLVVAWMDLSSNDGNSYGVYARTVAANNTLAAPILVNTTTAGAQYEPSVSMLSDGGFVVVWRSDSQDGSSAGVYGQRFNAAGAKVGSEFLVNTTTNGGQYMPSVVGQSTGGFTVAWYSDNSHTGTSSDTLIQEYDATGAAIGSERKLVSVSNSTEYQPAIADLGNGSLVVVYADYNNAVGGNNTYEIQQQIFGNSAGVARSSTPQLGDFTGEVTFAENQVNSTPQVIDPAVSVTNFGSASFDGGRLDLFYVQGGQATDQLGVRNEGNAFGQIGLAGAVVSFGGVAIGTLSGGANGSNLVITFNAAATTDAVEALVQNLTYATTSQSPGATRTVGLRVSDGDGGSSESSTFNINVTLELDGVPAIGSEEPVSTYSTSTQETPGIAVLNDGSYVITWASYSQDDANSNGVYFQRFTANGTPMGPEVRANAYVESSQEAPSAAALSNGGFVLVWGDNSGVPDGSGWATVAQRYDAQGQAQGDNVVVNTFTSSTQYQGAAAGYTGGYAVVWSTTGNAGGNGHDIFLKRYDNSGTQTLAETRISTVPGQPATAQVGGQHEPDVAARPDGSLVIVWEDQGGNDSGSYGVYGRTVSAAGVLGDVFLVNTHTTGAQYEAKVALLSTGGFVVVWRSDNQDGSSAGVYAQRFDAAGAKVGTEFLVNESTTGGQYQPAVAATLNGGFVVSWYNDNYDITGAGTTSDVYVREYNGAGQPIDGQRKLVSPSNSTEYQPAVAHLGGGNFVVAYADYNTAANGGNNTYDIVQQVFGTGAAVARQANPTVGDFTGSVTFAENLINTTPQVIDPSVSVSDADSANFAGGRLDLFYVQFGQSTDQLGVRNQGNAAGQIGVSGATVSFGGTAIGTVSGGSNGSNLVITLNAAATPDAVEVLVQNLTYASTSQSPGASRTVGLRISDGDGGSSLSGTVTINVTAEVDGVPLAHGEEPVSIYNTSTQETPAVAVLSDGSYVVTWASYSQDDANSYGVYFQRHAANGTPIGPQVRANSLVEGTQEAPSVAALSTGGFVVVWGDSTGVPDGSGWATMAQRYDAQGLALGDNVVVNTFTSSTQYQGTAAGYTGGYAVVFSSTGNAGGNGHDIYLKRYDNSGVQTLAETRISTVPGAPANAQTSGQHEPDVAARADGSLVIVWEDQSNNDGSSYGVYGRTVSAAGVLSDTFLVNTHTAGAQYEAKVAMLSTGGFVVVWRSDNQDGSSAGVYAQRFDAAGAKVGGEFLVNERTTGGQYQPDVAATLNGGFVVTWYNDNYDITGAGTTSDVYVREFNAAGQPLDGERKLVSPSNSTEYQPAVAHLGGGNFVVAYADYNTSANSGNNTYDIVQQVFGTGAAVARQANPTVGDFTGSVTFTENLVNATPQVIDVSVSVSDADSANFAGGRLDLFYVQFGQSTDQLGVRNQGNAAGQIGVAGATVSFGGTAIGTVSGGTNGSNLVVTLDAAATLDAVEALVQNLTYASTSQSPGLTRTVGLRLTDGDGGANAASTVTINVTPELDGAPVSHGPELVNSYTEAGQNEPHVAALTGGGYVVTWQSSGQDGSSDGVYFQRFAANGVALGLEQRVNTAPAGLQAGAYAAGLSNGGFVIVYSDSGGFDGSGLGTVAQRYDASGVAQGANFVVNTSTSSSQQDVHVAGYTGGFATVWASFGNAGGNGWDIYLKRFDNAGVQTLAETRISTVPGNPAAAQTSTQYVPAVAARPDGSLVIVWEDQAGSDSSSYGVYARTVSAAGVLGDTFLVNTHTTSNQYEAKVAILSSGDFVVVWRSDAQDGSSAGVFAQRFNAAGVKQGSEFLVNESTTGGQYMPDITALSTGGFVVTWYNDNYDLSGVGSTSDVYVREYSALGVAMDGQRKLLSPTNSTEYQPAVADLGGGNFVVVYADYDNVSSTPGNNTYEIVQQLFGSGAALARGANPVLGDINGVRLLSNTGATVFFVGNPQLIDGDVSVSDTDSANFDTGRLSVTLANGATPTETLAVRNQGNAAGQIGVAGNVVSFGGVAIATFTGGVAGTSDLEVTFNASATATAVRALVENITYQNASAPAGTTSRYVNFRLTDGDGGASSPISVEVRIQATVTPTAVALDDVVTQLDITEAQANAGVVVDDAVQLVYSGGGNFNNGKLTVSYISSTGRAADQLSILTEGNGAGQVAVAGSTISYGGTAIGTVSATLNGVNGTTLEITFNASATDQGIERVIERLRYSSTSTDPNDTRTIRVQVTDSAGAASTARDVVIGVEAQADPAAAVPLTVDLQANTYEAGQQQDSSVARLLGANSGGYVITWVSRDAQDGSGYSIQAQRFAANGQAVGAEINVNSHTFGNQYEPTVTGLGNGGFVVAWRSDNQDGSGTGVYAQRFDASGQPAGAEFKVNTVSISNQHQPAAQLLSDGTFVVAYYSEYNTTGVNNTQDVLAQRFAADGSKLGAEFTINTNISSTQYAPKLAALGTGYVAVWSDSSGADGSGVGIVAQRFAADGSKLGAEILVNTTFSGTQQGPDVVNLAGGGFVVVWESSNNAHAQRFDAAGAKVGPEILVNNPDALANYSDHVRVAALETGGFVVAWDSFGSLGGNGYDVLAQQFTATGDRVDGVFLLNSSPVNTQIEPDVVGLAGGNFVASWSGYDQERNTDSTYGIFHRVFGTAGSIAVSAPPVLVDLSSSVTFDENLVNGAPQLIDANVGLSDADSTNFDGGKLWVSVISSYPSNSDNQLEIDQRLQDQLAVRNEGNGAGQVGVAGNTVRYGNVVVGTIDINGANGADLVVTFNASATAAAVEAVIENLTYANNSSAPGATRSVSVSVSDGDGGTSVPRLVTVNVTAQADGPQPLFGNEVVNTYRTSTQDEPVGAALTDGSYVIVWSSEGQDGSGTGVFGQRFAANGERLGAEFEVNTHTLSPQSTAAVTALTGGGFVVTWQSQSQDGSGWGTYAQRFANDGTAQGAEFRVNTTTSQSQYTPVVTATADGGFVVAWYYDYYNASFTELGDIFFQRYNAAGVAQGAETQATPTGLGNNYQYEPAMAGLSGGGFVILWRDDIGDGAGNGTAVNGRIFNAAGVATGDAFQVNTFTLGNQYQPDVAALAGGGFVATWYSDNQDSSSGGIYAQRFDAAGGKVGTEFRVHIDGEGNQTNPSVTALTGGGFAISYLEGGRTYVQQFAADGVRIDGETLVDTLDINGNSGPPDVFGLTGGGLVVAWRDYNYSNSTYEVYQQIFGNPATTTRQERPVLADVVESVTFDENLVNATPQVIDASIDVSDADSANFAGGTLWVSVISGYGDISYAQLPQTVRSQDQLGLRNEGNGAGQVGVSGNSVSVGGVVVGTITSNGANGTDLIITFNASATEAALEAVVENLTYGNSSSAPVGSRQISISLSDGDGGTSEPRLVTVNVTPQADGAQPLFGNEAVNTYEPGTQSQPSATGLADGGYVVTWTSAEQDGWDSGVHAQRFDANGVAKGSEFKVNTYTPYQQNHPSVTALTGGGYVILWTSQNQDGNGLGVYGQRFDAAGVPLGDEFLVNSGTGNNQSQVNVASLPAGGFLATWYADFQNGEFYNVRAQRYDGNGNKVGAEIEVDTPGAIDNNYKDDPAAATFADGSFVIVWRHDGLDGSGTAVSGQRFTAAGAPQGASFRANTYTDGNQYEPDVAVLNDGGFVVVWRSDSQDGSSAGIFGQRYAANGAALGAEFRINVETAGNETDPEVVALSTGGFAVTYYDSGRVAVQQFAADGSLLDNELRVDTHDLNGNASEPTIAALANGAFVVAWTDYDYTINNYQVFQQLFANPAQVTRQANPELVDVVSSVTMRENTINAVPQLIDPGVGLFDADSPNFDGGLLEVNYITGYGAQDQLGRQGLGAQDQLGIRHEGNGPGQVGVAGSVVSYGGVAIGSIVSAGANGAKLAVQFNANASVDAVEQVIEALTYANTVSNPIASRTVSIRVTDGDGGASTARSVTINVTPEIDGAVRAGLERTVNTTVTGQQQHPEVTRLADGGYVVVWEDQSGADGSSYGVYGQRYDLNDNPVGGQFRANTFTSSAQYEAQVQALTGGGFVVVWRSDSQDASGTGVYAQRYNSDGSAAGTEFRVNSFTAGNQYQPTVDATADGGFIVAWLNGEFSAANTEYTDIFFQRFNASGVAVGAETRANPLLGQTFLYQSQPSIAVQADGTFVVVWTDNSQDGNGDGVFGQRFNASGVVQGPAFQVNSYTTSTQDGAKIAALKGGGFVVAWQSQTQDLSGWGVYAQRFDAAGGAVGAEFRVNTTISSNQYDLDIAELENGGWVVTWYSDSTGDVYLQQYNSAGAAVDGETRGNNYTYSTQSAPAVVSMADGGFVLAWAGYVASSDADGNGAPDGGNDTTEIRLERFSNTAPEVTDVSVSGAEEALVVLTAALFESGFNDADGQTLQAIKIITLPTSGTLRLNGAAVVPDQEVSLAQLQAGLLTYTGNVDFFGLDQFRWTGSDGTAFASTPVFTRIDLSNVNDGPRLEAGADDGANEGNFFGHNIVINDPDPEGHRITVNWGDGSAPQVYNVGNTPNHQISHVYADNGSYNVSVTADDQRGLANSIESDSFTVTVANVAPTLGLGGNANVVQGDVYTLTLGGVNDPGADTVTEYRINWGDGSPEQVIAASALPANRQLTHNYSATGNRTISVTLVDEDGTYTNAGSKAITVAAPAESITVDAGADTTVNEGTNFNRVVTFTDPNDQAPAGRSYTVNWGDGTTSNGFLSAGQFSFNIGHAYADDGQTYTVLVTVDDSGAQQGSDSFTVGVQNVAPVVNLGGNGSVNEGSAYVMTLNVVEPGADTITQYQINWGDGSAVQTVLAADLPANRQVSHVYADGDATRNISVAVVDEDGTWVNAGLRNVFVNNVGPTAPVTGADTVAEGGVYTLNVGVVTDPGQDTRTLYTINWGDGASNTYTVAEWAAAAGVFNHTYGDGGNGGTARTITVSATDEDGSFTLGSKSLTVTNVSPGLVLGGAASTNEGASYVLNVVGNDAAGAADPLVYTISWGDGSADQVLSAAQLAALGGNVAHTYTDDEDGPLNSTTRNISVTAVDGDGGSTTEVKNVSVNNVAPTAPVTGADTVAENSAYTLSVGAITDPGVDTRTGYTITWGDGASNSYTAAEWLAAGGVFSHTYADGGNGGTVHTVVVSATDEDGTFTLGSKALTVTNVAPQLALAGAASTLEGASYVLNLAGSDAAGAADPLVYTISWGDGSADLVLTAAQLLALAGNVAHTFADDEDGPVNSTARTISVTVADGDGGNTTQTKNVSVNNVAPTIALSGAATVQVGQAYTLNLGAITDPGTDTVSSYVIDWGDGSTETVNAGGNVTHTYGSTGARVISVDLVDEDGTYTDVATVNVAVQAATPNVAIDAGADASINEGQTFTRTVNFSDGQDNGSAGWTYSINYGDGTVVNGSTLVQTLDLNHVYADGNANHTVTVTVTDVAGETASDSFGVSVNNVAPTAAVTGADTVAEGSAYVLNVGAVADPGADTRTGYTITWGDGASSSYTAAEWLAAAGVFTHTYADGGNGGTPYTVVVSATDEDGTHTLGSQSLTVTNVAPQLTLGGAASTNEGASYVLNIAGSDAAGAADPLTYTISWGDGSADQVLTAAQLLALGGNVAHTFADDEDGPVNATVRSVSVTVNDADGGIATQSRNVTVNNVAPTAPVTGADTVAESSVYTLNVGVTTDPGADTRTGYTITWGDGASSNYTAAEWLAAAGVFNHTYVDGGNGGTAHTVLVSATDEDGTYTLGSKSLTVTNVAPQLTLGGAASTLEGASYVLNISGSDAAGAADPLVYTISWGDGSADQVLTAVQLATLGGNVAHIYTDDEDGPVNSTSRTISVTVADGDGGNTTQTKGISVNNVAPTTALSGAASVQVGQAYTLNLGAITDPGTDTVTSYVIDWGDGSTETVNAGGNVTHTYGSTGARIISVDLVDEDGTHPDVATVNVSVQAATPNVSIEAGADASINEGQTFTRTVNFSDGQDNGSAGWTYSINYGDGTVQTGSTLVQTLELNHTYTDGNNSHTVTVTVTDVAGETASGSFGVTVNNVAPTAPVTGNDTVAEGAVYTLNVGAVVEPGADTRTSYNVAWGDGSVRVLDAAEWAATGGVLTHTYADGADAAVGGTAYTVVVSATDEDGTFVLGSKTLTVTNVAPQLALAGADSTNEGAGYVLNIVGGDAAGANDPLLYTISWGDGSADQVLTAAQLAALGGNVAHTFGDDEDGPVNSTARTISVTVADGDGGITTQTKNLNVNNVAPTIALSGAASVQVGQAYTLNLGAITDPGQDTVSSYVIDWGDGTTQTVAAGGNVTHTYGTVGSRTISVDLVDEDGTYNDVATLNLNVELQAVETLRIGDAPVRQSGSGGQWSLAWTHADVDVLHKADATSTTEAFTAAKFNGVLASTLAGGDIYGGDLGVSGQSTPTSAVRQEIDGKEVLRFELAKEATEVTVNLSQFFVNDDGTVMAEAGRLRLLDDTGAVVAETQFTASSSGGQQQVSLSAAQGFVAMELSAGALSGTDFVFGSYAGGQGTVVDAAGTHGSDFLVDWVEFDFPVPTMVGLPPLQQDPQ